MGNGSPLSFYMVTRSRVSNSNDMTEPILGHPSFQRKLAILVFISIIEIELHPESCQQLLLPCLRLLFILLSQASTTYPVRHLIA